MPQIADFHVLIDGNPLSADAQADVLSLSVSQDIDAPGMFTMEMYNWDMTQLQVKWVDDDLFAPGKEVEIQMGYLETLETLLVGDITGLEPVYSADAPFTLTVRGHDKRHRLLRGRKTRSFLEMTDSDIAGKIASDAGLQQSVEDTEVIQAYVLQHNQTDWDFLQARAKRIGYEVGIDRNMLQFRKQSIASSSELTLRLNDQVIEFTPRLTTLTQVSSVDVHGWDLTKKESIQGTAAPGKEWSKLEGDTVGPQAAETAFGKAGRAEVRSPISTKAEADQMAEGLFNTMALAYITAEGVTIGTPKLRAGMVVEIQDVGERFGGLYYVTSTTHTISARTGYQTAFTAKRNAS